MGWVGKPETRLMSDEKPAWSAIWVTGVDNSDKVLSRGVFNYCGGDLCQHDEGLTGGPWISPPCGVERAIEKLTFNGLSQRRGYDEKQIREPMCTISQLTKDNHARNSASQ